MGAMRPVTMAARAQLRRRRGSPVALVLLGGLAGGAGLAAGAGASRTNTAMDRFVAYSRPEDVYVVVNGPPVEPTPAVIAQVLSERARITRLPQVADAG